MNLLIKEGVNLNGLSVEAVRIIHDAARVWRARDEPELVITSAVRQPGARFSYHQQGDAIDLRRWGLADVNETALLLQSALGPDYDVVVEHDHIHIEYDRFRATGQRYHP